MWEFRPWKRVIGRARSKTLLADTVADDDAASTRAQNTMGRDSKRINNKDLTHPRLKSPSKASPCMDFLARSSSMTSSSQDGSLSSNDDLRDNYTDVDQMVDNLTSAAMINAGKALPPTYCSCLLYVLEAYRNMRKEIRELRLALRAETDARKFLVERWEREHGQRMGSIEGNSASLKKPEALIVGKGKSSLSLTPPQTANILEERKPKYAARKAAKDELELSLQMQENAKKGSPFCVHPLRSIRNVLTRHGSDHGRKKHISSQGRHEARQQARPKQTMEPIENPVQTKTMCLDLPAELTEMVAEAELGNRLQRLAPPGELEAHGPRLVETQSLPDLSLGSKRLGLRPRCGHASKMNALGNAQISMVNWANHLPRGPQPRIMVDPSQSQLHLGSTNLPTHLPNPIGACSEHAAAEDVDSLPTLTTDNSGTDDHTPQSLVPPPRTIRSHGRKGGHRRDFSFTPGDDRETFTSPSATAVVNSREEITEVVREDVVSRKAQPTSGKYNQDHSRRGSRLGEESAEDGPMADLTATGTAKVGSVSTSQARRAHRERAGTTAIKGPVKRQARESGAKADAATTRNGSAHGRSFSSIAAAKAFGASLEAEKPAPAGGSLARRAVSVDVAVDAVGTRSSRNDHEHPAELGQHVLG